MKTLLQSVLQGPQCKTILSVLATVLSKCVTVTPPSQKNQSTNPLFLWCFGAVFVSQTRVFICPTCILAQALWLSLWRSHWHCRGWLSWSCPVLGLPSRSSPLNALRPLQPQRKNSGSQRELQQTEVCMPICAWEGVTTGNLAPWYRGLFHNHPDFSKKSSHWNNFIYPPDGIFNLGSGSPTILN